MTSTNWLPIRYRDFYDVPRIFAVEYRGTTFLFDCPFDAEIDDYRDDYRVFRVPAKDLERESWLGLTNDAKPVGQVAVNDVVFDDTRRRLVDDTVFTLVGLG